MAVIIGAIILVSYLWIKSLQFKRSSGFIYGAPLQWRHNGCDGVPNHQPHVCLPNHLFRRRSKKTSQLRVTGLCEGNSPVTGGFPAQTTSNAENVSIWWRHHAIFKMTCRLVYVIGCPDSKPSIGCWAMPHNTFHTAIRFHSAKLVILSRTTSISPPSWYTLYEQGDCCNIWCPSEIFKLKSREISFAHILFLSCPFDSKCCPEHGRNNAERCEK